MSHPENSPNLESPVATELPVRALRSPYFILRTPIGGFYLDPAFNALLVKSPVNALSLFLADAQRVPAPGSDLGEVKYQARENLRPLRYLHEGALQEFANAASDFYKGGTNSDQTSLRIGFRLPDPGKEPDAYWVYGDRFAPRLLILWGCEKEQGSSLPLIGEGHCVVKELRAKAMSWTRLFREGVELSRLKDPLMNYLAFPVLSPEGKLTHVDRLKDGQYVREEVHAGHGKSLKVRPLNRLPARVIAKFKQVAGEFYRKGHANGCTCPACATKVAGPAPGGGQIPPRALSYEQELRRGFRLPDPERRPDAYFVAGPPLNEQLLILCPHPGLKDAEEITQLGKDLKWAEDKTRSPEDKQRVVQLRQQFEQDQAVHNLYQRYFYAEDECLPLTSDETLGLAATAPKPSGEPGPLAAPTAPPAQTRARPSGQTVVAKLKCIDWGRIMTVWGTILFLIIASGLTTHFLWPKHLTVVSVENSNDPGVDPDNNRNMIRIEVNNRLDAKHFTGTNAALSLRFNGNEIKCREPLLNPTNHRQLTLAIDMPGVALAEDGKYTLSLEGIRDVWGNVLTPTNVPVKVVDLRPPSLVGKVLPASAETDDGIQIGFDEPMDEANAIAAGNYSIPEMTIRSAELQKDRRTVILKAEKPFDSGASYQLTVSTNLTDASHAKNHLRPTTVPFKYAQIPLRLESVSAVEDQIHVKVVFNKPYNPGSAKSALKLDPLKIGAVQALDNKALELVLTNSYLTNGAYTLQINGLTDLSGKAGNALTTNCPFTYEGAVDTTPPVLMPGGLAVTAPNRLELTFSKNLREEAATKEGNYVLSVANGETWQKLPTRFRAELVAGVSPVVALNFSASLPNGTLRLEFSGVEDFFGNSTNGSKEFSTGIQYPITRVKAPRLINPERTMVQFTLSHVIDQICEKAENFQLEDTQGRVVPGINIINVTLAPKANSTVVSLELSKGLPWDSFQVRFQKLRLAGEAVEQNGVVPTGQ